MKTHSLFVGQGRRKRLISKVRDEVRFLKSWAGNPLTTGAVAPSGRKLAQLMAAYVEPERAGRVLELGPGTGAVTRALIRRGVQPEKIVSIEYNGNFATMMRERFPAISVVEGDAYALRACTHMGTDRPLASIVSSLPLLSRPPRERRALIEKALDLLEPGAPFIQFSYGFAPPVKREAGNFELEKTRWIVSNVPPARVWVYRRPTA
ncbi:MAG: methyltransferase domain-containing protein [Pseudomonadota bacterium]